MANKKWEAAYPVLQKATPKDLQNVCHTVAESIVRDGTISSDKFSSLWGLEEWWQVRQALTQVFTAAVGGGWSNDQITEHLGSLKDEHKKAIVDIVSVHNQALRRRLLQDTAAVSKSVLTDFDWKLKLALSSDKMATVQEPLLQVDFDVQDSNGGKKQVFLELNKAELAKLISSLESCSKSVQQMTTT